LAKQGRRCLDHPEGSDWRRRSAAVSRSNANLETDQFLLALRRSPDQHQHAFAVIFHASLQEYTVRPHIQVSARRQIPLLPMPALALPLRRQTGNHRRRQVRRILAQQRRQVQVRPADDAVMTTELEVDLRFRIAGLPATASGSASPRRSCGHGERRAWMRFCRFFICVASRPETFRAQVLGLSAEAEH
jgi:hypothetical protein